MMNLPLIMFYMERTLITRAIRFILSLIDQVVYYFISSVFQAIFDLSNMPFETEILNSLTGKVYIILSIFMFFKITISLITYLVNPDTIADKQVGIGKLVSRVIITLIMLIALPFAFDELMDVSLNEGVLETLPRLIIGSNVKQEKLGKNGDFIAWNVLNGFVHNNLECTAIEDLTPEIQDDAVGTSENFKMENAFGQEKSKATVVLENINLECESNGDLYYYDYTPLISTIAGGFLLYVIIGIAINVAVRAFKLMILRLIAPIPIISYMDPKSGKDGAFNKWIKMIFKTWLELYIHLAIIYFVVFLLKAIVAISDGSSKIAGYRVTVGVERSIYLTIFLVLGLFFFAKQAPKFISEALGLKGDTFGDIFKMAGAGVGVAAAGGAMIGAGISSYKASRMADDALGRNHSLLRNVGAGLFGAGAGGLAGMGAALNAKDHNSRAALDAIRKRNQSNLEFGRNGGTFFGALGADASRFFSGDTAYDREEAARKAEEEGLKAEEVAIKQEEQEIKELQARDSHRKAIMDRVNSKTAEADWTTGSYGGVTGNYRAYNSAFEAAKGGAYSYDVDAAGNKIAGSEYFMFNGQRVSLAQAEDIRMGLLDDNKNNYYEQTITDAHHDDVIAREMDLLTDSGGTVDATFGDMKGSSGAAQGVISRRSDAVSARRSNVEARHRAISDARNSNRTQAQKANAGRHGGNGSGH